jgi:hypothetical protein
VFKLRRQSACHVVDLSLDRVVIFARLASHRLSSYGIVCILVEYEIFVSDIQRLYCYSNSDDVLVSSYHIKSTSWIYQMWSLSGVLIAYLDPEIEASSSTS